MLLRRPGIDGRWPADEAEPAHARNPELIAPLAREWPVQRLQWFTKDFYAASLVERDVVITGGVPWSELPAHYAAGDVFAMPCRTPGAGLDVEGLGIVLLEASATGVPVVAGRSGGAPETVLDGETGRVVDGRDEREIIEAICDLLADPQAARRMGQAGRRWISRDWNWQTHAGRLADLLRC